MTNRRPLKPALLKEELPFKVKSNGKPVPVRTRQLPMSDLANKIKLRARKKRIHEKTSKVMTKEWSKNKPLPAYESPVWRFKMVLSPDIDIESPEWIALEDTIEKVGMGKHGDADNGTFDIVRKSQGRFADIVFFDSRDISAAMNLSKLPEINHVVRLPSPKSKGVTEDLHGTPAFFALPSEVCSTSETLIQATKIDVTVGSTAGITNNGGGTALIIWDFLPSDPNDLVQPSEFSQRPGGAPVIFSGPSGPSNSHGVAVASTAGGLRAGLASGANMALLGVTDNAETELATIDEAVSSLDMPTVVNMSFAMTWTDVDSPEEISNVLAAMTFLDSIVQTIKDENTQVSFIAASGNESINPCSSTTPLSWTDCNNCMIWPQFKRGISDTPIDLVGAVNVNPAAPNRQYAPYSNNGSCIPIWSSGSIPCSWDISTSSYRGSGGTSFASPVVSALMSLGYSRFPELTDEEVFQLIVDASASDISGLPAGSINQYSTIPADFKTGGLPVDPSVNWGVDIVEVPLYRQPGSTAAIITFSILGFIILALILWWGFKNQRGRRRSMV